MHAISQNSKILKHLKSGRTLTALRALQKFGCLRLAARIEELRALHRIRTTMQTIASGKRIAVYKLK